MTDERDSAIEDAIAKVRQACDDIEAAWNDAKGGSISDDAWEQIERARNRLESTERRLRTLLETRPGPVVQ